MITEHPLYAAIDNIKSLSIFMEHHVFATWDFMCLLKVLYGKIVCTSSPWFPPKDAFSAHLISSILTEEEGDITENEEIYASHFETYLLAMEKIGADFIPIKQLLEYLQQRKTIEETLNLINIPLAAKKFVLATFSLFNNETPAVAAAFVFGREAITQHMFLPIVERLKQHSDKKDAEKLNTILFYLRDQPVTIFCAAPTVLRKLVAEPNFKDYIFPHLKKIVTVGEALDETVINQFAARGVEVPVAFGQAETVPIIGRVDGELHLPNTMGKAIAPYKVVLLDDDFNPLSPGNTGQIAVDIVDGAHGGIMRGYAKAFEATQKAVSPDGRYYLTGDYAKMLSNGFFVYDARKSDKFKSNGITICPDEVEKAGMSHPAVAKIAIIGVPPEPDSLNRIVKAYILLKPNYSENPELIKEIQEHIKKETAPYQYPRLVECLSLASWELFETTSGKIRRAGLRDWDKEKSAPTVENIKDKIININSQFKHNL